jgi:hypothetical protein
LNIGFVRWGRRKKNFVNKSTFFGVERKPKVVAKRELGKLKENTIPSTLVGVPFLFIDTRRRNHNFWDNYFTSRNLDFNEQV